MIALCPLATSPGVKAGGLTRFSIGTAARMASGVQKGFGAAWAGAPTRANARERTAVTTAVRRAVCFKTPTFRRGELPRNRHGYSKVVVRVHTAQPPFGVMGRNGRKPPHQRRGGLRNLRIR